MPNVANAAAPADDFRKSLRPRRLVALRVVAIFASPVCYRRLKVRR
jgi:hypothetical protein